MGSGWELVRKTFGVKLPELVIGLERPLEAKKLPASSLTPMLIPQLGSLQINYIATDTLRVQLDEKMEKTFYLAVDSDLIVYKEGYGNTGLINVIPNTVIIDGPESVIQSIPDTILLPVKTNSLSKTFQDEVEVPLFKSESINRNPPVVTVVIEVGAMETIETWLKLTWRNPPRSMKNRFADSVKVSFRIPTSKREHFREQEGQISAWMDIKTVNNGSIVPLISGMPIYAKVISIDSSSYKID
jgi:hypothetical protein